jgi:primosomal protein N' (replication factor Y)
MLVKVFPLLPFSKTFDYLCFDDVCEGDVVSIQFGKIATFGVVVEILEVPEKTEFTLKEVNFVLLRGVFNSKLIKLVETASKYNTGSVGMFLRLCFPFSKFRIPEIKEEVEFEIYLSKEACENSLKSKLWKDLWGVLKDGAKIALNSIRIPPSELAKITNKELVQFSKLEEKKIMNANLATLSTPQKEAFKIIESFLESGFKSFLLNGETGSGKTEVYFHLIYEVIKNGGQVLLTLPEIALSSAILSRFKERFGFDAILWHSSVSEKKRILNFMQIINGEARVIIGTRSAIFLPFKNLKLIIVDEEHDGSYKQEETVIYNGRDMAVMRGFIFNIPIILGSATPSIETYNNTQNGKYLEVKLENRFFVSQMPTITVVDMKQEKMPKNQFISTTLKTKMMEVINSGGQVMFFLNRRGYAPIVLCSCCGERVKCKFCDVHLTEHRIEGKLKCHHCGYTREKPQVCEACCVEDAMKVMGAGVERIQEELCQILPKNQVVLLTSDTLSSQVKTREVINKIESGEAKVIVGTQVVSKGYHFPNLRFVGVLDADFGLNIEDFRAFEKTFQLLYQVAGRTGREKADGEVYIQTFDPKNKVLFSIVNYDKSGFYSLELEARRKFKLPPFSKQIAFVIFGDEKQETLDFAKKLTIELEREFKGLEGFSLFGPSVPIISFLRNRYRFRILILSVKYFQIQEKILKVLDACKPPKSVNIKIDVDPISFY